MVSLRAVERTIKRMVTPVQRRATLALTRALVSLVDDSEALQTLQLTLRDGQVRDDVENFQPLGLSSVPAKDAECVAVAIGGDSSHLIALGVNDRETRPKDMSEGETKIYSAHGNTLYLNKDGECVLEDSTGSRVTLASSGDIDVAQSGTLVNLAGASDFVALAALVDSRCTAIETALGLFLLAYTQLLADHNTHTHTSDAVKTGTGPPFVTVTVPDALSAAIAPLFTPGGSTAATNVKGS